MAAEGTLGDRFFDRIGRPPNDAGEAARVAAALRRARDQVGGRVGHLDEDAWLGHVAGLVSIDEVAASLEALALDDLAFAIACAAGDTRATGELERTMIASVPRAIARLKPTPAFVDSVQQALREKLLVASDGSRARILDYRGRGPLGAWVRVVALRIAYDEARARPGLALDDDSAFDFLADGADAPDIAHLKTTHAADVKAAFAEATRRLSNEERLVLRAHVVDGLTIDQIAALYQVHRATAARWLQHARNVLASGLRDALAKRLGIEKVACDSLVAFVRSRIDLSLDRVLDEE